jgi:hypothetical protein
MLEVVTEASGISWFVIFALIYKLGASSVVTEDLIIKIESRDYSA